MHCIIQSCQWKHLYYEVQLLGILCALAHPLTFLLVFWRWFAVVCLLLTVFTAYRPKFWCEFVVVCGDLWTWTLVVSGGLS